ncbi:hypothetical protein BU23DRAFT_596948 [Bimuria novae-zelandiae CBS 107.79]|uniref:N-acetyltransferase domain-containing protein n=1 Tax=Bimuria novae-zelandiae CBS 107.79 TaxID=1447943 RepID=A0A6A5VH95_9PLEO|nr:hypothetical protein BU23DRAFT_596948 [Bimuria novae-zelandiae CBS 107.79]
MAHTNPSPTLTTTPKNHPIYTDFLAQNLLQDPVLSHILNDLPWHARPSATYHLLRTQLLLAAHKARALFVCATPTFSSIPTLREVKDLDPRCCAVVLPPGETLMDIGMLGRVNVLTSSASSGWWNLLPTLGFYFAAWKKYESEYLGPVEAVKASVFREGETFYSVMVMATAEAQRGKGLARKVLGKVLERARREGKPVWAEASSTSRGFYAQCGFEDVGEAVVLGRRCVEGKETEDVLVFPMVLWPEGYCRRSNKA